MKRESIQLWRKYRAGLNELDFAPEKPVLLKSKTKTQIRKNNSRVFKVEKNSKNLIGEKSSKNLYGEKASKNGKEDKGSKAPRWGLQKSVSNSKIVQMKPHTCSKFQCSTCRMQHAMEISNELTVLKEEIREYKKSKKG